MVFCGAQDIIKLIMHWPLPFIYIHHKEHMEGLKLHEMSYNHTLFYQLCTEERSIIDGPR